MYLEIIILNPTEKDKYHMTSLICGILKLIQMNLFIKQKQTQTLNTNFGYQRGKVGEGIN